MKSQIADSTEQNYRKTSKKFLRYFFEIFEIFFALASAMKKQNLHSIMSGSFCIILMQDKHALNPRPFFGYSTAAQSGPGDEVGVNIHSRGKIFTFRLWYNPKCSTFFTRFWKVICLIFRGKHILVVKRNCLSVRYAQPICLYQNFIPNVWTSNCQKYKIWDKVCQ